MDHAAARRAYRASTPHQPGVWGADGPLLLGGGASRIPAEVMEGWGRGAGLGWRHQYPGSNRERREDRKPRMDGQGPVGEDHRLCGAECPAGDPLQLRPICHTPSLSPVPSFQQRVERFHENPGVRELLPDTYISRTISLVNCGPPP